MSGYLGTMTTTGAGFSFQVFGSKGWHRLEGVTHVAGAPSEERRTRQFGACKFQPVKGAAETWEAEKLDIVARHLRGVRARGRRRAALPDSARADHPRRVGDRSGDPLGGERQSRKSCVSSERENNNGSRQRPRPPHLFDAGASRRHLGGHVDDRSPPMCRRCRSASARTTPFGVSLRLSNASAHDAGQEQARARQAQEVSRRQQHVSLHRERVPLRAVQEPDRQGAGLRAGLALARSARNTPSTSRRSSPTWCRQASRPRSRARRSASSRNVTGKAVVDSYTEHVMRVAAHLIKLEERTGRTVTLALEPEPFCFLETTDETVDYFTNHLYTGKSAEMLAKLAGIPISEAIIAQRKFVGTVFDICHQAVVYEDIADLAAEAGRRRHSDLQAAGSRRDAHSERDAEDRRHAQALRQDDLSDADRREEGRQAQPLPQSRRRLQGLGERSRPARMAHAFPRAGVPRRSRRVRHHALRHRGRAASSTSRSRCRASSRSRPTPGTCCRTI